MLNPLPNANNVMLLVKLLGTSYECPAVKMFWEKVIDWWNRKRSENINPNPTEVLYGYKPESNSFHTFNHYLLIARYYVYLARNKFETQELEVFRIVLLEIKTQCEREITITNGNLNIYRNKWTTLSMHFWLVFIYSNLANAQYCYLSICSSSCC